MKVKKIFKGMTAAAMAAILAASMVPMTAFADSNKLIVSTTAIGSATKADVSSVVAYKVAVSDNTSTSGYKWNTNVVDSTGLESDFTKIAKYTSSEVEDLALQVKGKLKSGASSTSLTRQDDGTYSADSVDEGYYLIIVTPAANAMTTYQPILIYKSATEDATVSSVKSESISIDKEIIGTVDATTSNDGSGAKDSTYDTDVAQVGVGDTVNFKITTQVPAYNSGILNDNTLSASFQDFIITDTPSDGITLDENTSNLKVYLKATDDLNTSTDTPLKAGEDNDYTVTISENVATVTLNKSVVLKDEDSDGKNDYAGYYVFVTLDGTLNSDAVIAGDGNDNTAEITFSNDYATGSGSNKQEDKVKVYTAELDINKIIDGKTTALPGAKFIVYQTVNNVKYYLKSDGTFTTTQTDAEYTTSDQGKITFERLSAGTYCVQEISAPNGYNLDNTVRTITVGATLDDTNKTVTYTVTGDSAFKINTDNKVEGTISNTKSSTLPGTGGVGTIIFTATGIGIVLLAGVMLVVYMKKRKSSEE